jgi:hypothetical protein
VFVFIFRNRRRKSYMSVSRNSTAGNVEESVDVSVAKVTLAARGTARGTVSLKYLVVNIVSNVQGWSDLFTRSIDGVGVCVAMCCRPRKSSISRVFMMMLTRDNVSFFSFGENRVRQESLKGME